MEPVAIYFGENRIIKRAFHKNKKRAFHKRALKELFIKTY